MLLSLSIGSNVRAIVRTRWATLAAILCSCVVSPSLLASPLRITAEQASSGYNLPVTFDVDQLVILENDQIIKLWLSNDRLFKTNFLEGGSEILLQANSDNAELKLLPELGRQIGTVTVKTAQGRLLRFNLQFTQHLKSSILLVSSPRAQPTATRRLPSLPSLPSAPPTSPPQLVADFPPPSLTSRSQPLALRNPVGLQVTQDPPSSSKMGGASIPTPQLDTDLIFR